MADWFTDMVEEMSDEVIKSPETASKLALTDRVTAEDLKAAVRSSENELRAQFAVNMRAIQEIRDDIQRLEDVALAREYQALTEAKRRAEEAQTGTAAKSGRVGRLRQRLHLFGSSAQSANPVEASEQAVASAQHAYDAAKDRVDQSDSIRKLGENMARHLPELRKTLYPALMLKVNQVIDDVLDVSYERDFSYTGRAVLTDPLGASVEPVNTDAYGDIKYFIDKVGSGTIGVAGPRGSGKTTLLSRFAVTEKRNDEPQRWGVCVAAPTKYNPRDFLLYLFAELCREALGRTEAYRLEDQLTSTKPQMKVILPWARGLVLIGSLALACYAVVIGLRTARLSESPHRMTDLVIACCCAIVFLMAVGAVLIGLSREAAFRRAYQRSRRYPTAFPYSDIGEMQFRGAIGILVSSIFWLSVCTAIALFILLMVGDSPNPGYLAAGGLGLASIAGLFLFASYVPDRSADRRQAMARAVRSRSRYVAEARKWYVRAKFQQSFTTGWSGTIALGNSSLPVQAQGGTSGSTAVTPLAMSTPEIIDAISAFTQELANCLIDPVFSSDETERVPVVIGIDEIDKIDNPRDAQAFLNQIKALFGGTGCVFLVSISDDAMAAFERRGMPFRDAFDSSLSTVVTLSYLSRKEARILTGSRLVGVQEPVADLLFVLSGGLARDLVRLIRQAVETKERIASTKQGETQLSLDDLALELITAEIETKKMAVLAQAHALVPCPAKGDLLTWAGKRHSGIANAEEYFTELLTQAVSLIDAACASLADQAHLNKAAADAGNCAAREIGVFIYWLVTVGQVFSVCSGRENFIEGESGDSDKSFERLAEAKQNFPIGPDYVLAATKALRAAWQLPDDRPAVKPLVVVPPTAQ